MKTISQRQAVRIIRKILKKYPPINDSIEGLDEFLPKATEMVEDTIRMICAIPEIKASPRPVVFDGQEAQKVNVTPRQKKEFKAQEITTKKGNKVFMQAPDGQV